MLSSPRLYVAALLCWQTLAAVWPSPVQAQGGRVALVIGNSEYVNAAPLDNPKNDAADMAAALEKLGFKVIKGIDLDKAGMDRTVRDFAEALVGAKVGLLFYAGHGMQVGGQNYLVPIDARLTAAAALDFEMVRLDVVHRAMEQGARINIIMLDACRDNPLARNLARAMGTRSAQIGRGLATVESGEGTLISFSTQPGNVALDGTGRNSPYAAALLKHIGAPGDDLPTILINVRNDVMASTERRQVPWEHSAMTARFFFSEPKASPEQGAELKLWDEVKDSTEPAQIETYLRRYPQGSFAVVARALVTAMEQQRAAEASLRERQSDQEKQLLAAREEVRKAQEAVKAAEAARLQEPGSGLARFMAAAPSKEFPFDGVWIVEALGGEHCPIKRSTQKWIVHKGAMPDRGRGPGRVSSSGVVDFSRPASANPKSTVVFKVTLAGDKGSGSYHVIGGRCSGKVTLARK